jgi:hypothetical protein
LGIFRPENNNSEMKKFLLLGIFGLILGFGFTVPALAGAQIINMDDQAMLAIAVTRLGELEQQFVLVADTGAPTLSAADRVLLLQALSQLATILSTVEQRLATNQIPAEKQPAIKATIENMRTTLASMGTTLASMNANSNVATQPEAAPYAPIAQAPATRAPQAPQAPLPIAQAPSVPSNPLQEETANVSDAARNWTESWNFWLILLLVAVAGAAGVLLRRRSGPTASIAAVPPSPPSKPTPPPQEPQNPNQS